MKNENLVKIEFLGPINKEPLYLNVGNLADLGTLLKEDGEMTQWLEICAVAVNDMMVVDKNISLKAGDTVSILPPVCGG